MSLRDVAGLRGFVEAACEIAAAEGMKDETVLPVWPDGNPSRFPELTVGALRDLERALGSAPEKEPEPPREWECPCGCHHRGAVCIDCAPCPSASRGAAPSAPGEHKDHGPRKELCICPGCSTMVPACWESGLCRVCIE